MGVDEADVRGSARQPKCSRDSTSALVEDPFKAVKGGGDVATTSTQAVEPRRQPEDATRHCVVRDMALRARRPTNEAGIGHVWRGKLNRWKKKTENTSTPMTGA